MLPKQLHEPDPLPYGPADSDRAVLGESSASLPRLLTTKFAVPVLGSDHLPRPQLIRRLEQTDRPLTLLVAPQGYGKTTLLSEWAQQSAHRIAWVTLDDSDSDARRFWRYLLSALDLAQHGVGTDARLLLDRANEAVEEAVVVLINMLTLAEPMVLVLDSYEQIGPMTVHQELDFLLDHLPPTLRIVLACRGEPPLALARRRATDQLTEFGVADLQFTLEEMTLLLRQIIDVELSFEQRALLAKRTEGWVAGIRLAARLLRSANEPQTCLQAFTGAHRDVQDYLEQEILRQLSGELQAFMLQTALCDRLCASLCDAMLGNRDSQAMLMALERSGLFLFPLAAERSWYRYHPLVAEALRYRLYQQVPDLTEALRQRMAAWYASQAHSATLAPEQLRLHEAPLNEHAIGSYQPGDMLLSQRERQVLRLLADGYSNQQIAEMLIIGINTVKMHIQHLYDKLDVHNRVQALAQARRLGLI